MRAASVIFATIVFTAILVFSGQARAEPIMCPETVTHDISAPPEGWTSSGSHPDSLSYSHKINNELRCVYAHNFTLTRTLRAGANCREVRGGVICEVGSIVQRPTGPSLPSSATVSTCDLAVRSITLTKTSSSGDARISYEIINLGPRAWSSSANEATATLVVNSASYLTPLRRSRALPARGAPGAVMATVSVDLSNPFYAPGSVSEFSGGTVDVSISYAGLPRPDSTSCTLDIFLANNSAQLTVGMVREFLEGSQATRTWTFAAAP